MHYTILLLIILFYLHKIYKNLLQINKCREEGSNLENIVKLEEDYRSCIKIFIEIFSEFKEFERLQIDFLNQTENSSEEIKTEVDRLRNELKQLSTSDSVPRPILDRLWSVIVEHGKDDIKEELLDKINLIRKSAENIQILLNLIVLKLEKNITRFDINFMSAVCGMINGYFSESTVFFDTSEKQSLIDCSELRILPGKIRKLNSNFVQRLFDRYSLQDCHKIFSSNYCSAFLGLLNSVASINYYSKNLCNTNERDINRFIEGLRYNLSVNDSYILFPNEGVDFLKLYFEFLQDHVETVDEVSKRFLKL